MDGIAAIQARIQEIVGQFSARPSGGVLGANTSATAESSSFASVLAEASSTASTDEASMPTSTGALNKAGVEPVRWAKDFLTKLGMPVTSENVKAVVAWQKAEGTAAKFNPLATTQPWDGATKFNSVGVRNFATYQDGVDANVKVITNGLYENVLAALRAGDSAEKVAQAIAASPWGTGNLVSKVLAQGT
jgi:hypothetical protein